MDPALGKHIPYVRKTSKKLARKLFHQMLKHGPKLEREQMLLAQFVDIGTELYAQVVSASRAQALIDDRVDCKEVLALVEHFSAIGRNVDREGYRLAQSVLGGGSEWLFDGMVEGSLEEIVRVEAAAAVPELHEVSR
jgi:hypothetical protein